jgi:hypothetical protein
MGTAEKTGHLEIHPARSVASAIGRVIWTFFAFLFVLTCWAAVMQALLDAHQVWSYALRAIATILFVLAAAGLRIVCRDGRYW